MAVFQGARLQHGPLPAEAAVRARSGAARVARPGDATRSSSGARPMGILIAVILVATMVGLAYLTQTLGSNATSTEIGRLNAEGNKLRDNVRSQAAGVDFYTDPGRVADRAAKLRLKPLGEPHILRTR